MANMTEENEIQFLRNRLGVVEGEREIALSYVRAMAATGCATAEKTLAEVMAFGIDDLEPDDGSTSAQTSYAPVEQRPTDGGE